MAETKFDGVIEAVRYTPEGKIQMARVYLRRGPTWSDRVLLTREELVERVKAGKRMMIGSRVPYMAGTFDVSLPVQVKDVNGQAVIYTSQPDNNRDQLEGAPVF